MDIYQVKIVMFYNAQTKLTFTSKIKIHGKKL
jgi:hypothetical protein